MRIPRLLISTALAVVAAAPRGAAAQAPPAPKFAYIDSRAIVSRAPGTATAEAALQKDGELMQARVRLWQDSLKAMVDGYGRREATLTPAQKEAEQKRIEDRRAAYARRADSLDNLMQQRQAELSQPIMAQIRETLDAIRTEEGYTFIFDVSAAAVIVAADKNLDITEKVIGRLKPIPVVKADSAKAGVRPQPAGIRKPPGS